MANEIRLTRIHQDYPIPCQTGDNCGNAATWFMQTDNGPGNAFCTECVDDIVTDYTNGNL